MNSLATILYLALDIMKFMIIAKIIISWLVSFQVLNIHQPLVYQIYTGLQRLFEPIYAPIRRLLPNLGPIDITPMIVLFGIIAAQIVIANNFIVGF